MNLTTILDRKLLVTLIVLVLVGLHILWDYTHGGVPVHYPLADDSLPAISNWWGLLSVPLLTWGLLSLIQRRKNLKSRWSEQDSKQVVIGFVSALFFGGVLALCWEMDAEHIMPYLILLPLVLALFIPVHRAEHLLGFVLAMAYTFGGVLPILIGSVLLLMAWGIYKVLHQGGMWVLRKLK